MLLSLRVLDDPPRIRSYSIDDYHSYPLPRVFVLRMEFTWLSGRYGLVVLPNDRFGLLNEGCKSGRLGIFDEFECDTWITIANTFKSLLNGVVRRVV